MRVNWLQFFRKTHLYAGIFTAPAILFFAVTGALQTFSLHETARGAEYKPPRWITVLAQIHKKQTAQVPIRKSPPQQPLAGASGEKKRDPDPQASAQQPQHNLLPLKVFFLVVAVSLFISTASGLCLGWKYRRDRLVGAVLLLAGIVIPILLLQL